MKIKTWLSKVLGSCFLTFFLSIDQAAPMYIYVGPAPVISNCTNLFIDEGCLAVHFLASVNHSHDSHSELCQLFENALVSQLSENGRIHWVENGTDICEFQIPAKVPAAMTREKFEHDDDVYILSLFPADLRALSTHIDVARDLLLSLDGRMIDQDSVCKVTLDFSSDGKDIYNWKRNMANLPSVRMLSYVDNLGYLKLGLEPVMGDIVASSLSVSQSPFQDWFANDSGVAEYPFFSGVAISMLDPTSAGFHRSLVHRTFLDISSIDLSMINESNIIEIDLKAFLIIGSGIFIDLDEPFSSNGNVCALYEAGSLSSGSCDVLVAPMDYVIDIEQPSFASPQNIVGFNISLKLNFSTRDNGLIAFIFATNIHLRYQMPTMRRSKTEASTMSTISIPQLELVKGSIYVGNISIGMFDASLPMSKQNQEDIKLPFVSASENVIMKAHVATGFEEDKAIVLVMSLIASVVGALFMMRSISKVSNWS